MKTKDEVIDGFMERNFSALISVAPSAYNRIQSQVKGIWKNGYQAGVIAGEDELEKARGDVSDAYQRGKDDAFKDFAGWTPKEAAQIQADSYKAGKDAGYKECLRENNFDSPCVSCDGYRQGVSAAWNAAEKAVDLDQAELCEALGFEPVYFKDVFEKPAFETVQKINSYKSKRDKTNAEKFKEIFGYDPHDDAVLHEGWLDTKYYGDY